MATEAEKIVMYREKAKDTSVPQEVRNTYLDRANELERKLFEASKAPKVPPAKLAKGGVASKKPMIAIMIGVGKPMKAPTKKSPVKAAPKKKK
jgi:hypothetical protein